MCLWTSASKSHYSKAVGERIKALDGRLQGNTELGEIKLCTACLSVKERWRWFSHDPKQNVHRKHLLLGGMNPGKYVSYVGVKLVLHTWVQSAHAFSLAVKDSYLHHAMFPTCSSYGDFPSKYEIQPFQLIKPKQGSKQRWWPPWSDTVLV